MRPGYRIRSFAARVLDEESLVRFVDPTIADLQFEHARASLGGRRWHARWIHAVGLVALARVLGSHIRHEAVTGWSGDDARDVGRSVAISILVTMIAVVSLAIVPFVEVLSWLPWSAAILLLPQAVPVALPIGLLFGIVLGFGASVARIRTVTAMVAIAIVTAALSFVTLNWFVPDANQAFRTSVFQHFNPGRQIARGTNELGLTELRARLNHTDLPQPDREWRSYYLRFAIPFAPIAVTLAGLGIVAGRRLRMWQTLSVALLATGGYCACLFIGMGFLPPLPGSWLPNVACLAAAIWVRKVPRKAAPYSVPPHPNSI